MYIGLKSHSLFQLQTKKESALKISIISAAITAIVLSACGKIEEPVPQRQPQVTSSNTMDSQIAAIKACMQEGLSEDTCDGVHKQMATGTLNGSPSIAACEAQYGAGQCGKVPVARADGSSGDIILPLIAGAALGYLAHSLMSSNSMPAAATAPQRAWVNNRPAVYQSAVERERAKVPTVSQAVTPKSQAKTNSAFMVKDGYGEKKVTVNGKQFTESGKLPTMQPTPGAVKPVPVQPATATIQQRPPAQQYKVEQKPQTSPYAQPARQAAPAAPPAVRYNTSPTRSGSSGGRR